MGITVNSGITLLQDGVPPGGSTGQVLTKVSSADYDTYWAAGGGGGGVTTLNGESGVVTLTSAGGSVTITTPSTGVINLETAAAAPTFDLIGSGTNTTAAMVVGTGGSLAVSGSGTIAATTSLALTNARTIGGVSFNGTANITVATATGGFTVSGGDLAIGANNLTITGSIGATGSRVTKGWFVDLEVTNAPTAGGVAIPTISSTNTLTNKRITVRTDTVASSATPTINTDNVDYFSITALAAAITSFTTNLSGTPTTAQRLSISITDNGTARGLTWGASFEASGTVALPTTTVISTRLDVGFVWNEATSKWRCVAVA